MIPDAGAVMAKNAAVPRRLKATMAYAHGAARDTPIIVIMMNDGKRSPDTKRLTDIEAFRRYDGDLIF